MKILFVAGTRPEIIKLAPLMRSFANSAEFEVKLCVTGQHKEMLNQMLDVFELQPDYNLSIMSIDQSLDSIAQSIFFGMPKVFAEFKPEWLCVQGDTTTASMAAISAFNNNIKIMHVEAGLRSYNLTQPWPEEANRKLISAIADLHLAPTDSNKDNLLKEGVAAEKIFVTGNTVIDALYAVYDKISTEKMLQELRSEFSFLDYNKKLILVTGHRRENFGEGHENIFNTLLDLVKINDVQVIYPVHLNPNVNKLAHDILQNQDDIFLIPPVDYHKLVYLLQKCYLIITDSGGIQEEAPTFGKPVIVTRKITERLEAIKMGSAKLVGSNKDLLLQVANNLINNSDYYESLQVNKNPFGDGMSSERIVNIFSNLYMSEKVSNESLNA